jgi:hypothetical protein
MAEGKEGFIMYKDYNHVINKLTDEQAGKLLKHILAYVNDEYPETDDIIIEVAFEPMKQRLKKDLKKWETICEKRSESGKKGAEAKKQSKTETTSIPHDTNTSSKISRDSLMDSLINGNEIIEIARVTKIPLDFVKSIIPLFKIKADMEYNSNKEFVKHFKNTVVSAYEKLKDNPITTTRTNKLT